MNRGGVTDSPLQQYRVLVADADYQLAQVVRKMLMAMKFQAVEITSSGKKAFDMLGGKEPFDFIITDSNAQDMDGLTLTQEIRRNPDSSAPMIPVIMLSGRAEMTDVIAARDKGVNEYVAKPFTSQTIFSRIQRIVEKPRSFVVSKDFVGPDRRVDADNRKGSKERRVNLLSPQPPPRNINAAISKCDIPKVWVADYSLRNKLGHGVALDSLVTDEVLHEAQDAIAAIADDSLKWIKESLQELEQLFDYYVATKDDSVARDMAEMALTINSRAGTFGYPEASKVAYQLHLFCLKQLKADGEGHIEVVRLHMQVLQLIFGKKGQASDEVMGKVVGELKRLCKSK